MSAAFPGVFQERKAKEAMAVRRCFRPYSAASGDG